MKRLTPKQVIGQVLAWGLFVVLAGTFAQWPRYSPLPEGHGEIRLSMAHLTERLEPCEELSHEELARLPPSERVADRCPRARAHAVVELRVDGELLLSEAVRPTGLAKGGRSYLQGNWSLPAGDYVLELFLRDTPREEGFDKEQRFALSIAPGESVLLTLGDGDATLTPGRRPDAPPEDLS